MNIKIIKRLIIVLLCIAFFITSCAEPDDSDSSFGNISTVDNSNVTVMSYNGVELTSGMYAFIFSALKTNYLYLLQIYGDVDYVEDTELFWNSLADSSTTFANAVTDDINNHCKMLLICKKMADDYIVSLSSEDTQSIYDEYNDYVSAYGGEENLEKFLSKFGLNADKLNEYLTMKQTVTAVQNALCAEGGLCEVKEGSVIQRIAAEYVKVKHVYLLDEKYDGDAMKKANELLDLINSGEKSYADFADLSDDNSTSDYPNGFLVNISETEERYSSLVSALQIGQCGVCEADEGAYLIMRIEMTDEDYETKYDAIWENIADEQFASVMENLYDQVEINKSELEKYNIITAPVLQ